MLGRGQVRLALAISRPDVFELKSESPQGRLEPQCGRRFVLLGTEVDPLGWEFAGLLEVLNCFCLVYLGKG